MRALMCWSFARLLSASDRRKQTCGRSKRKSFMPRKLIFRPFTRPASRVNCIMERVFVPNRGRIGGRHRSAAALARAGQAFYDGSGPSLNRAFLYFRSTNRFVSLTISMHRRSALRAHVCAITAVSKRYLRSKTSSVPGPWVRGFANACRGEAIRIVITLSIAGCCGGM